MLISIPSFHSTSIRFRAGADFDSSSIRIQTPVAQRRFTGFYLFVARLCDAFWLHLSSMRLSLLSFLLPVARTSPPKRPLFRLSPSHVTLPPNQAMQRTLRARHELCCRTSRAVPYASLIFVSLGSFASLPQGGPIHFP